jgi:hypothetical protein
MLEKPESTPAGPPPGPPPPEQVLMQMMMAKMASQCLTVVANLSVADQLAGGAASTAELAEKVGANPDGLYRVLRALAALGIFRELPGRRFENNEVSALLRGDVPHSLRAMVRWLNAPCSWQAWGRLDHSVKTGKPSFDEVHGQQVFAYFREHEDAGRVFNEAMTAGSGLVAETVAKSYNFSGCETIVDVGGGHGALLNAIVSHHEGPRGIVFDLPEVVEGASEILIAGGHADRIDTAAGDFFEGVPGDADVYLMKHIIHDWSDEHCVRILDNCRRAMKPGGRVLVIDQVVSDAPEAAMGKMLDLEMLVMTDGGRERTEAEFAALFERAGLELARIVRTESFVCLIEGVAP